MDTRARTQQFSPFPDNDTEITRLMMLHLLLQEEIASFCRAVTASTAPVSSWRADALGRDGPAWHKQRSLWAHDYAGKAGAAKGWFRISCRRICNRHRSGHGAVAAHSGLRGGTEHDARVCYCRG